MFQQFNLYIILGLVALIVILGGGWWYQSSRDATTIDALKANNVRLEDALALNERTIAQMIADAQTLAASNSKLTSRIVAAEMEFVDQWAAINALELESDTVNGDTTALEGRVNSEFQRSVEGLQSITGK